MDSDLSVITKTLVPIEFRHVPLKKFGAWMAIERAAIHENLDAIGLNVS